ncbi:MAG: uroporphyrinogen III methyltransferase/synthase [Rhodothermales bacterium]
MLEGPLKGRRVLVTRAPEQAEPLSLALKAAGAVAVRFPTIRFVPGDLSSASAAMHRADWLLFTSANGVRFFFGAAKEGVPDDLRIAAVGTATANALSEFVPTAILIPDVFDAEHLAAALPDLTGQHCVIPQAEGARDVLARDLKGRGATVETLVAYSTVSARPEGPYPRDLDALTFTSPSTVTGWKEATSGRYETPRVVACIGPITAAAAQNYGLRVDVVADPHTAEGLVAGLIRYFQGADSP